MVCGVWVRGGVGTCSSLETVMKVDRSFILVYEVVSVSLGSRNADIRGSLALDFQYGVRTMFCMVYPLEKLLELFQFQLQYWSSSSL